LKTESGSSSTLEGFFCNKAEGFFCEAAAASEAAGRLIETVGRFQEADGRFIAETITPN
jgi:hypothetical protein